MTSLKSFTEEEIKTALHASAAEGVRCVQYCPDLGVQPSGERLIGGCFDSNFENAVRQPLTGSTILSKRICSRTIATFAIEPHIHDNFRQRGNRWRLAMTSAHALPGMITKYSIFR
jgi:hypothetical protein